MATVVYSRPCVARSRRVCQLSGLIILREQGRVDTSCPVVEICFARAVAALRISLASGKVSTRVSPIIRVVRFQLRFSRDLAFALSQVLRAHAY